MEKNNHEMDELLENIGQWIGRDEARPCILNPVRMQQIHFADTILHRLANGTGIKNTTSLHDPFNSMGCIIAERETLGFADCKWLGRAIEFANNIEIYLTQTGKIRITLTFHGLTMPIEEK